MDSGGCASRCRDSSDKLTEKSDDVCTLEVSKEVLLQPPTPDTGREIGDLPFDCNSPITAVEKLLKGPCLDSHAKQHLFASIDNASPKTPKDGVFDPFAPGSDDMLLAPLCKKHSDVMKTTIARRLKFDYPVKKLNYGNETPSMDVESISDEEMFESVYEIILETVFTNQAEGPLAEIAEVEGNYDCCKTPSASISNAVAETCPGAPMKSSGKSRNIDLGLCRKLEF
ncbi:hypothetical protein SLE2022_313370 [Rubroshorea leprosula]